MEGKKESAMSLIPKHMRFFWGGDSLTLSRDRLSFLDETEPIWLMVRLLAPPSFCSVSALGGDGRDGNFRMYSAIFVWLYYPQSPVLEKISLWG